MCVCAACWVCSVLCAALLRAGWAPPPQSANQICESKSQTRNATLRFVYHFLLQYRLCRAIVCVSREPFFVLSVVKKRLPAQTWDPPATPRLSSTFCAHLPANDTSPPFPTPSLTSTRRANPTAPSADSADFPAAHQLTFCTLYTSAPMQSRECSPDGDWGASIARVRVEISSAGAP